MVPSISRVAVIGSGVMGGALAAHFAGAGTPTYLLDIVPTGLTPEEEAKGLGLSHPSVRNRIAAAGLEQVRKSRPPALVTPEVAELITVGNLEDNFDWIGEADWVVEAVVERLEVKSQLMARIDAIRKPGGIVSSNTSGIPISSIADGRSPEFKAHFLGTHFFNPPRYLKLLEIIPGAETLPEVVKFISGFGERALGKRIVVCRDRPSFVANRLATFCINYLVRYAVHHGYSVEEVDAITGPVIGRPNTAFFRLIDLVGLDVIYHVSENLYQAIPTDEQHKCLKVPDLMREMVNCGWLGDKKGQGFYRSLKKDGGRETQVLDLQTMEYRLPQKVEFETLTAAKRIAWLPDRLRFLISADDKVGRLVWAAVGSSLAYSAMRIPEIADDFVSLDNAMKWGFSHEMGPFEIWDALGVAQTAQRMEAEGTAVSPWVKTMLAGGHESFYRRETGKLLFYDLSSKRHASLPARPEFVVVRDLKEKTKELVSNPSASLVDMGDGVLLLEFRGKMNALDADTLAATADAVKEVETSYEALVVGNQGDNFSVGANLHQIATGAQQGAFDLIDRAVRQMQDAVMALRYCQKPVVAAPFGLTLGGGAEMAMAASCIVAACETYMGQVEVGVGLLPAGGGCKELLRRVVSPVARMSPDLDVFPLVMKVFELVSKGKTSASAEEARQMGLLTQADRIVMNRDLLLHEAKRTALHLTESGYRPPARTKTVYAIGERGLASLKVGIFQMLDGGYISPHDALVAGKIAYVLSGGELTTPQWVDERYILDLEREAFVALCREPKTQERIWNMLRTGKALRN